jgi:hypothetical protein
VPWPRHLAPCLAVAALASVGLPARAQGEPPAAVEPSPTPSEEPASAPAPYAGQPPQPTPPTPGQVFSGTPVPKATQEEAEEHSWFDQGHAYVGRLFFMPIFRLDRFFSDQSELEPERSRSYARLRGSLRLRQDGPPSETVDFYADLHLPGVNRVLDRFRLVLASAADSALTGLYGGSGTAAPFTVRDTGPPDAELRFGAFNGLRSSVDLGAGLLVRIPFGAFVRARWRTAVPIRDLLVSRFAFQTFWRTDMLFGVRGDGALERPLGTSSLVRLGATAQAAERKTNGVDYGAELVWSHAFSPTIAMAVGSDGQGSSRGRVAFDKYRFYARARHDVLRRWLFVEVEPEAGWPWTRDRGRYRAYAVTLRLEVQFSGEGAVEAEQQALDRATAP